MTRIDPSRSSSPIALGVLALGLSVLAACSIETRSDEFRCTEKADCAANQICQDGWCLVPECPNECDSCLTDGTCVFDCSGTQACPSRVTCLPGRACSVRCLGDQSCAGGVDCGASTECSINCGGDNSCAQDLLCGSGSCNVNCNGAASCIGTVDCGDACACDTSCGGAGSCPADHICPTRGNCDLNGTCRSNVGSCDSC